MIHPAVLSEALSQIERAMMETFRSDVNEIKNN